MGRMENQSLFFWHGRKRETDSLPVRIALQYARNPLNAIWRRARAFSLQKKQRDCSLRNDVVLRERFLSGKDFSLSSQACVAHFVLYCHVWERIFLKKKSLEWKNWRNLIFYSAGFFFFLILLIRKRLLFVICTRKVPESWNQAHSKNGEAKACHLDREYYFLG